MIKVRVIDKEGKDEVHTVLKMTEVDERVWFYGAGFTYYLYKDTISFMQVWGEE